MIRILIFLIISSVCFNQENIDSFIQDVLKGNKDVAELTLPVLENDYPNNSSVLFLKGLLESDGEKAMQLFSKLYSLYPTSTYGDDSVMKVAEYYYAAGLYIQASDWLKKMPIYYSRSEHIERAVKLFLNSLIVSGHKDTAIFYSRVFKRQFPYLNVDGKVNQLIREFDESEKKHDQAAKKENNINLLLRNDEIDNLDKNIELIDSKAKYSIQTGAFSLKENAEMQNVNLSVAGFNSRIVELRRNNNKLYAVRVGFFNSRKDADDIVYQIKLKMNLDSIVIIN